MQITFLKVACPKTLIYIRISLTRVGGMCIRVGKSKDNLSLSDQCPVVKAHFVFFSIRRREQIQHFNPRSVPEN